MQYCQTFGRPAFIKALFDTNSSVFLLLLPFLKKKIQHAADERIRLEESRQKVKFFMSKVFKIFLHHDSQNLSNT